MTHTPEEREVVFLEQVNDVLCDFQSRANRRMDLRENIDETTQELLALPRIAAAPDLLEALTVVLDRYEFALLGMGQTKEGFEGSREVVAARAAIAKAEGATEEAEK